ncbi:MAG: fimbria/pilus periplasmic chaperone [Alphaproteobacteria bacterium]
MKHTKKHNQYCLVINTAIKPSRQTKALHAIHKIFLAPYPLLAFAIFAVCLSLATPVLAMSVTPVAIDMTTSGRKARGQITIVNDGTKQLPVEILVKRLELDENGNKTTTPANDDFYVTPVQTLIDPGATQTIRLQWKGNAQIPSSQHYAFLVNQVPVTMPKGQSGVQVVFNFETIVNIAPPGGKASIQLLETDIGKDSKGITRPAVRVKNPGNSYAKLSDATIKLSSGSWSKTLTPGYLRQSMGMGLLQAGKTRRILLPVDVPRGVRQITASIEYKPRK